MRIAKPKARATAKADTHARIVAVAARAIRRSGYGGTGVADIMKAAGLTHGAFYAHFDSREAMLAEASAQACAESAAAVAAVVAGVAADVAPPRQAWAALLSAYLSQEHLEHAEGGCPLAALGSETARQAPAVRRVTTGHVLALVDLLAQHAPEGGPLAARDRALVALSTLVGSLLLARAVNDPALSDALRAAALKHLGTC